METSIKILEICLYIMSASYVGLGLTTVVISFVKIMKADIENRKAERLNKYNDKIQMEMFKRSLTSDVLEALNSLNAKYH